MMNVDVFYEHSLVITPLLVGGHISSGRPTLRIRTDGNIDSCSVVLFSFLASIMFQLQKWGLCRKTSVLIFFFLLVLAEVKVEETNLNGGQ